eukprot:XP_014058040.1 PREDICTED: transmembrane channel-like protein 6 [Salmo salar]
MAYSVDFNLSPIMELELESLRGDDTAQDSMCQLIRVTGTGLESGSPKTLEMDVLTTESRDRLASQMSDVRERADERRLQRSEESMQTNLLVRNRWSAATLRVLSSMPSRSVGQQSRLEIISQCNIRSTQLRRYHRQTKDVSLSSRPSIRGYGIEADSEDVCEEETKRQELVNNLQSLSAGDRVRMLRAMPLSLAEKTKLRKLAFSDKVGQSILSSQVPCCSLLKRTLYHILFGCLFILSSLQLWQVALKRLGGRFGTGVLSYFLFIRTLLLFNVFLFLINGLFLVLPQAIHPPLHTPSSHRVTGLELFTGTGYLSNSLMFYGYYTNSTINTSCRPAEATTGTGCGTTSDPHMMAYNIPLAYFFTIGITFFITGIVLVYSMSKSFGRSFRVFKSQGNLAIKIFCSWDFKVSKKMSVRLQSENITTQLKELLSEVKGGEEKGRLSGMAVHLLAWSISLGSTFFCALGIHCFAKDMHLRRLEDAEGEVSLVHEARLLALPGVVSCGNLLLPGLFNLMSWMENFNSPIVCLYVSIFRKPIQQVPVSVHGAQWNPMGAIALSGNLSSVRLISLSSFVAFRPPQSSLLVNSLVAFLPQSSLLVNCQAPRKPWRASQMSTLFISLLCFPSFLGATVSVTYTIWTIKPSSGCGPFRNLPFMFHSGKQWAQELKSTNPKLAWLNWVHSCLVENPLFLFLMGGVFLMVIYIHTQIVDGQRKIISLLQEQMENEGKDKKFLITRLQAIHEERQYPLSPSSRPQPQGSESIHWMLHVELWTPITSRIFGCYQPVKVNSKWSDVCGEGH